MSYSSIEGFRPSPQQKHVWLLQQFDRSLAYRAQCAIALEGNLKPEILKQALQDVVNRHSILRTTFHVPDGMKILFQVVGDSYNPSWRDVDLTHLDPTDQELKTQKLFQEDGFLPFDLQRNPLLRMSLLRLSNHKHVLLFSLPALCADVSALNNLVFEISQSYAARIQGEEIATEVQFYAQFSEWQNEILNEPAGSAGKDYWRKQNISSIPAVTLPCERKPRDRKRFEPAALAFELRSDVVSKIADAVKKYNTSAPVLLLTCWQVLLWRLTRQAGSVIGAVFDGRPFQELENAVGLFAKTIPIRCHFHGESKFSEVLLDTNVAWQSAHEWQEYFSSEQSDGSATSRLEAMALPFGFEYAQRSPRQVAGDVSFTVHKQYVCIERFKIKLSCIQDNNTLAAELLYDPELVAWDDISGLAGQYQTLVKSALDKPEALIGELAILTEAERRQLLFEFNDTRTEKIVCTCFPQLFEQQVDRTPDDIAVLCEGEQLTYDELNIRANQLAHHLRRLGVGPEIPVALWTERSIEMVTGLLAILKAGGAYVPLDPALPKERLAIILDDSHTSIVLTQKSLVENLPERKTQMICLDTDWHLITQEGKDNPIPVATTQNLAYIIFTSGSTGRPKGVAVEHAQLLHYLSGILRRLDLRVGASFAAVSTLAADLGNTAIFPALSSGGCLHVVTQERAFDPDALGEYFCLHAIDCLKIVPSHLQTLLFAACPESVLPRKRLVLGGDACSWTLIDKVQELSPDCVILNHYGPTETTIGVATYLVTKNYTGDRPTTPPIGRPIANVQAFVLDAHLQPVPIWVPGELYIGGDGLTRGYYNQPELTAEKFIPNPFSSDPGARLYKTGDLARCLPDGNIEFVGRIDNQIKIRGFRVELAEIEAALRQHPAVQQTVVMAREDVEIEGGGENAKSLVVYVVPRRYLSTSTRELRSFLKEKLPEYMLPSAFVMLDSLPLRPNGKVDYHALPAPDRNRLDLRKAFVPPRTSAEKVIAEIWAEILKLERIGIHDNFFDLGGHSLLATQIISRARKAFHTEIPLRALFENPTVASLAVQIAEAKAHGVVPGQMTDVFADLESLSEEEAQHLLAQENSKAI